MSKETFKRFVRSHPTLVYHVNSGNTSWQKLYEMYDLYGENNSVWNPYFKEKTDTKVENMDTSERQPQNKTGQSTIGDTSVKDIFNMIKSMDLETVRKGVDGLQKAVGLLQDFTISKKQEQYQARPLYKHLED